MNMAMMFFTVCLTVLLYVAIYLPYFTGVKDEENPKFI